MPWACVYNLKDVTEAWGKVVAAKGLPIDFVDDPFVRSGRVSLYWLKSRVSQSIRIDCLLHLPRNMSEALSSKQSNALVNYAMHLNRHLHSDHHPHSDLYEEIRTQYARISLSCFDTGICFPTGCDIEHDTGSIPSIVRIPPWQRGESLLGVDPMNRLYIRPDHIYALQSPSSLSSPSSLWSLLVLLVFPSTEPCSDNWLRPWW